jgi:glycogen synthase
MSTHPRPTRVLMTTDTVGGVWTFTMELAESLHARGFEVWMSALGGEPNTWQRHDAARIRGLRLFSSRYKLEWMDDPWRDVAESGRWLLDLASACQPDIVHLNSFGHGDLPWPAPVVLTAHSCVVSWWKAVKGCEPSPEWDRYRRQVLWSLKSAQEITTPSNAMASALTGDHGIERSRVKVIPNGRTATRFCTSPKGPMILTAGRLWDEAKNVRQLAQIASELTWPVYFAGESGSPDGRAAELFSSRYLGVLSPDALAHWYARASIYVLPARYEPFGLSALEAAFSGCALVLGAIPSLREIWQDAAVYVKPDDARALKQTIEDLIAHKTWREEMASRARRRARTFSSDRQCDGYVNVYRSAMSRRFSCAS